MRLARVYLQMLEGTQPTTHAMVAGVKIPLADFGEVSLSASESGLDKALTNPFLAARTLDRRLRGMCVDLSEGVDADSITSGRLVQGHFLAQPAHLQIQNYELVHPTHDPYYVVAFASVDRIPGVGRVFVGLVGSERNLIAMPGDGTIAARSAYDARGLYEMIQYTKEENDVDISAERLEREFSSHYEDTTEEQRLRLAAEAFHGFNLQAVPRPMEILFEVHHVARDVKLETLDLQQFGTGTVQLAMIGAPIWIREATDRTLLSIEDILSGPEAVDSRWRGLDAELNKAIRDFRYSTDWKPKSADDWRHFAEWAVAYAKRVGGEVVPLNYYPSRHRILGLEFGGTSNVARTSGVSGWVTDDWAIGYLLSTDAEVFLVGERHGQAWDVGADHGEPRPIAWDDAQAQEAVVAIVERIVTWLTPFGSRS